MNCPKCGSDNTENLSASGDGSRVVHCKACHHVFDEPPSQGLTKEAIDTVEAIVNWSEAVAQPEPAGKGTDAAKVRKKYDLLIGPLREEAHRLGYALAVHGSLARDIDLVAIPWTSDAVSARALAESFGRTIERVNGVAYRKENEDTEYFLRGTPGAKPHGRLGWVWHLGGTYIDLAVMPRTDPADMSGAAIVAANDGVFYIGVNDETGKMDQVEYFRDKLKQKEVIPVVPQSALAASQAEVKRLRELIERVWNIVDHGGYVGSATSAAEVIDLFAAFDARKSKSKIQGRNTPPQRSEP